MKKIICFLGFHQWFYKNKQDVGCYRWFRICSRCKEVEKSKESGNQLMYSEIMAPNLHYWTESEEASHYKRTKEETKSI